MEPEIIVRFFIEYACLILFVCYACMVYMHVCMHVDTRENTGLLLKVNDFILAPPCILRQGLFSLKHGADQSH